MDSRNGIWEMKTLRKNHEYSVREVMASFSTKMVDRSMFQGIDELHNPHRPPHILGSTIVSQNFLRTSPLFLKKDSSEIISNSPSSSVVAPTKQLHPSQKNSRSYAIMQDKSPIIAAFVTAPIERVYILMQCQNAMLKNGHLSRPYKGMQDCLLRTIKHEGVLSLWRGSIIRVLQPLTIQALQLAINGSSFDKKTVQEPSSFWHYPLGLIPVLLVLFPLEYARVRLATDVIAAREARFSLDSSRKMYSNAVGNRMFGGVFDVFKKTLKSDGIMGLYRGYSLAWVGLSAHCYAASCITSNYKIDQQTKENLSFSASVALSPIPFMSVYMAYYPVMSLTRRMMMTSGEATKYKGVIDAFCHIVKHEGASTLFKGFTPHLIHALSQDAAAFAFLYLAYFGINKLT